jgi:hypothetical protein
MEGPRASRGVTALDVWLDQVWPRLAGALVAIGLLKTLGSYGPDGTALMVVGLTAFMTVMAWAVLAETGGAALRAWRLGLVASVTLVTVVGVMDLAPRTGWLVVALAALTSPPVAIRAVALWGVVSRRRVERRTRVVAAPPVRRSQDPAQAAVDRAFDAIVRDLWEG